MEVPRTGIPYLKTGIVTQSINVASLKPDPNGAIKWFKEVKPMHSDAMIGLSVLLYLANLIGDTIYFFTDDATNFFNQMVLARAEYFKCEALMYDYKAGALVLVAEYCMSFGITPASNIAQRLAILIIDVVKQSFDAEEEQYMRYCEDPVMCRW